MDTTATVFICAEAADVSPSIMPTASSEDRKRFTGTLLNEEIVISLAARRALAVKSRSCGRYYPAGSLKVLRPSKKRHGIPRSVATFVGLARRTASKAPTPPAGALGESSSLSASSLKR